jgi:hypothetical protein
MKLREAIKSLNAARKGSLFESFYTKEINTNACLVRHIGCGADVEVFDPLDGRRRFDLKFWARVPRPTGETQYLWLDYLTPKSMEEGRSNIYRIARNQQPERIHTFDNILLEHHFENAWAARRAAVQFGVPKSATDSAGKKNLQKLAKAVIQKELGPTVCIKFRCRQVRTAYGPLTVAPAILPDGSEVVKERFFSRFDKTVIIVGENDWSELREYWVFDHKRDRERLQKLLEPAPGNKKLRIHGKKVPLDLVFHFGGSSLTVTALSRQQS